MRCPLVRRTLAGITAAPPAGAGVTVRRPALRVPRQPPLLEPRLHALNVQGLNNQSLPSSPSRGLNSLQLAASRGAAHPRSPSYFVTSVRTRSLPYKYTAGLLSQINSFRVPLQVPAAGAAALQILEAHFTLDIPPHSPLTVVHALHLISIHAPRQCVYPRVHEHRRREQRPRSSPSRLSAARKIEVSSIRSHAK